jgi:hypothetical protein
MRPIAVQNKIEKLRLTSHCSLSEIERAYGILKSIKAVEACIVYSRANGGRPYTRLLSLDTVVDMVRPLLER